VTDLIERISRVKRVPALEAAKVVPHRPGYYTIWVVDEGLLPDAYADQLRQQQTHLIYVGIAVGQSLHKRLVKQDLRHESGRSSFFRSLGAALGFRPPRGSLAGMKNRDIYTFSATDTAAIIKWIEEHLQVGVIDELPADEEKEKRAIRCLCPVLNLKHNPHRLGELEAARRECLAIARSAP